MGTIIIIRLSCNITNFKQAFKTQRRILDLKPNKTHLTLTPKSTQDINCRGER